MDKVKICFVSEDAAMPAVPEQVLLVPLSTTKENCLDIIRHIVPSLPEGQRYLFWINNTFLLTTSLAQIIADHGLSGESVVRVHVYPEDRTPQLREECLFPDWIRSIGVVSDGLATGCYDNLLRIRTAAGDRVCAGHKAVINTIHGLDDGTIVTGSSDSSIGFFKHSKLDWTVRTQSAVQRVCPFKDKVFAAEFNGTVSVHGLQRVGKKSQRAYQPLLTSPLHKDCVSSLFPCSSLLVSASHDRSVKVVDPLALAVVSSLTLPTGITCGGSLNGAAFLTGHADGSIRLLSSDLTLLNVAKRQKSAWVSDIVAGPDGRRFATADHKGEVCVFDTRMPARPQWSHLSEGKVLALAWSGSNQLFAGGEECMLREFIV